MYNHLQCYQHRRQSRRKKQSLQSQIYKHIAINKMMPQFNQQMRVQIQQLYPTHQRAQIQSLLTYNNNDHKASEIFDYNKQFWSKRKIDKLNQPSRQKFQHLLKAFSIDLDANKVEKCQIDAFEQLILYLNSEDKAHFINLVIQKNIHNQYLIPLVRQNQNSSMQFLSFRALKIIADSILESNKKNQSVVQIIKVLCSSISNDYEQFSNQIIQQLRKILQINPSYSYNCLTPNFLSNITKEIKKQFQKDKDIRNIKQKIKNSISSNRLVNLLKISHLCLASSTHYVRNFKSIKSIALNLVQQLISSPINIQFGIQLILILKRYVKKNLVQESEICFIFRHCELLIRILKRYNGEKKDILQVFIFGVSLQKITKQRGTKDMLYCLQIMINKEEGSMKEACWNLLANNTSKSCREAILLRKSLMETIFQHIQKDNTKNKVGFSLIINEYIQTTSIKLTQKRKIISSIYKPIFELLTLSSVSEVSIAFGLIKKIMKDSNVHVQKCEQFNRMGGITLLQRVISTFKNNKSIKDEASDIIGQIKLVLNGEVSDVSLNLSDNN